MNCDAVIATALRADGSTSIPTIGSTPPLRLMPTPDAVFIVGAAAGPLNGDRVSLEIDVAAGTELTVRSAAASMAWPGTSPLPSQFTIKARIGEGARLNWLPEQIVPVAGSVHRVAASIELEDGGSLVWREEIVLGRHQEQPGELSSQIDVVIGGVPLLRQENVVGAAEYDSPAVLGANIATGSITFVGVETGETLLAPIGQSAGECAALELESGELQVVASATTARGLRSMLDAALGSVIECPSAAPSAEGADQHVTA
jgi:urease accessory protein